MSAVPDLSAWTGGERFEALRARFDRDGYIIFERVLPSDEIAGLRAALAPFLAMDVRGRNAFEGPHSNRVYALAAKSPDFAALIIHPLALAFAEADLGADCLLSACLAINLLPGAPAQPWHYDDSHYAWPRPRPSLGVSAFWALDDATEENGATEVIPQSHLWAEESIDGGIAPAHFVPAPARSAPAPARSAHEIDAPPPDAGARADAVKASMPAGSLMLAKGTLWHRGGANRSGAPRLIITPQYCPGWTRPLENMSLAVPPSVARGLPQRAQELLGYSIRPPFMGYVDGRHPKRLLESRHVDAETRHR